VGLAPSFNSSGQQRVSKTESSGGESVNYVGVDVGIITVPVSFLLEQKTELLHNLLAKNDGKELVVGNVLDGGDGDATSLLQFKD
jgi:hypothetical protein